MSLKIAIIGSGAIGCYYGVRLALAGNDVRFLVRADYEAMRTVGLTVKTPSEELKLAKPNCYLRADEIGPVDLAIVTLKTTANNLLPELLRPVLGVTTSILTLQNGLGADDFITAHFGSDRVFGGLAFIATNRVAPGRIECYQPGSVTIGEYERPLGPRGASLVRLFETARIKCYGAERLQEVRWRKLIWNIPFNGLTIAAGGVPTDAVLANPALRVLVRDLMGEVIDAAHRLGYSFARGIIDEQIQLTETMGPYKPSSLIDFLARKPVEVEAIWGEPVRRAQSAGASVPRMAMLYALLSQMTVPS